jgi:hypothetical protein
MLPDYPSLKDRMMKERVAAFEREMNASMPIVSKFKKIRFHEGHAYSLERTDGVIETQEFLTIKEPVVISAQLDFDQTVSQVNQRMTSLAQDMATHMERVFASNFERVTAEVGNAINANGAPFTLELYLDALDRIDVEFDSFGFPIWPILSGHPATLEALRREFERFRSSSQLRDRAEAIVRKKREEWRVRESSRRLVN